MESVSIIIPTKNESQCLPHLLAALAEQSVQAQEIIIADAESTDNTRAIASAHGAIVVAGGLPAVGRNRGAEHARGDILLFLDADVSLLHQDFIKNILLEFQQKALDISSVHVCVPTGDTSDKIAHELFNTYVQLCGTRLPHAPGCCILVKKETHNAIGGFDERAVFCEDHDYARRAVKQGAQFGVLRERVGLNTRRQDLEGRAKLVLKYILAEMHLVLIGPVYDDRFKYHFDYSIRKKKKKEKDTIAIK